MRNVADPLVPEGAEPVKVTDRRRFQEDGAPREAPAQDDDVARLQQELDAARRRVDELARGLQASERDREDFKRRLMRERESLLDVERGNVAVTLLEAIDQLDLALSTSDESPLKTGVRMIRENLLKKAESTGIEGVPLEGRQFDPNLAEATELEVTAHEAEDGRVVAVTRACYALRGRVIRPGQVKVARFVKPAQA